MPRTVPVMIVDDNRLLRDGLAALIGARRGYAVVASLADAETMLARCREAPPELLLLDATLEGRDLPRLIQRIRTAAPATRVIVMGMLPTDREVAACVRAGAAGLLSKDGSFEEFFAGMQAVAAGAQVLPRPRGPSLMAAVIRAAPPDARRAEATALTAREREVIALLGEGLSNRAIAARLDIAVHTVKTHVHNVLEKLALHTRLEVAAFAHRGTLRGRPG